MNIDPATLDDERVLELLAACDEALAAGRPLDSVAAEVGLAQMQQVDRGVACIKLLREVIANEASHDAAAFPDLSAAKKRSESLPFQHLGRYEIRRMLGEGSCGIVYLAYDPQLRRETALKVPRGEALVAPVLRERFLREARAAAVLNHPNIIAVHEAGEVGPVCYIAAEYCPGVTLAAWLKQRAEPVHAGDAAGFLVTLALAMQHAHGRGVLHRDLKPSNIMLQASATCDKGSDDDDRLSSFTPKITDFSLAKFLQEEDAGQTHSGDIVGTPQYMAPEQAAGKGKAAGPAADIYALGAILYQVLTGRPPFTGKTSLDTLQQVLSVDAIPPRRLNARVPRDLEIVCLKCLEKEAHRRYASAEALAEDLTRFLADRPIVARPSGGLELAGRWCRRNPALAIASLLAVTALFGITIVSSLYGISSSQNARQVGQSAENLREALRISDEHRQRSELRLAEEYLERGRTLGDQGSGTEALLVLARALEIAPQNEPGLQHAIRTNIGSFADKLHRPSMVLDPGGQVTALSTSPDCTTIAAGRSDGAIVLWSAQTGARAVEFRDHQALIRTLAFSPDGQLLCSGSVDGTARLWRLSDSRSSATVIRHGYPMRAVTFSTDGSQLLTASEDGTVKIRSFSKGGPTGVQVMHSGGLMGARFDPQGKMFVTYGGADSACLWNAATCQPLGTPLRHERFVQSAQFSPDGRFVLTGSEDGTARLWEQASGKPVGTPCRHDCGVRAVAFSPTGERFATVGFDASARIWATATHQPISKSLRHELPVHVVAFSPDGSILVTGSDDQTVRLWDVESGEPIGFPLRHAGQIWGVGFIPDGRLLSWGLDDPVRLWHVVRAQTATTTLPHQHAVTAVAYSPNGKMVVTGTSDSTGGSRSQLQRWDASTCRPLGAAISQPWGISTVTFSPDGKRFANGIAGFRFGEARVWDAETGNPVGHSVRHNNAVRAVKFDPDGTSILTASEDRTVQRWKVATGEQVRVFPHEDYVTSLALSSNGKLLLTGSEDRLGLVWDMEMGKVVGQPLRHHGAVMGVALSRDGCTALTASVDHTAQLWDLSTQRPIGKPLRHSAWVAAAALSRNGLLALTASARRHASALGYDHAEADRYADAARIRRFRCRLQSGRQNRALRQHGWDGAVVAGSGRCAWRNRAHRPLGTSCHGG